MSEPQAGPSQGPETVSGAASAGTLLREARESQGAQVSALAGVLKVPVHQIEALEQDRLDQLPDLVFARALAASVCRQLKVDPQPVLARLPSGQPRLQREREPINEPFRAAGEPGGAPWRERLSRPPAAIALVLLLGAAILLALPLFQETGQSANAPAAAVTPPPPAAVPAAPAPDAAASAQPGVPAVPAPAAVPSGSIIENVTPPAAR